MIFFVTGLPGGGKSYFALHLILDELLNGERDIVTNLALKLPELRAYIQNVKGQDVDTIERIRILRCDDDINEVRDFYLHRGFGRNITPVDERSERGGKFPRIALEKHPDDKGVLYVIDEAHEHFHARAWQTSGLSIFWYLAKHRHFNDEVVFISQHADQCDKQLKLQVQWWHLVVNTGLDMGPFRLRGRKNHIKVYWGKTEPPAKNTFIWRHAASQTDTLPIEVSVPGQLKLGDCYETLAYGGVQVGGRRKETKPRYGRHPAFILVPILGLLGVAIALPRIIDYATAKVVSGVIGGATRGVKDAVGADLQTPPPGPSVDLVDAPDAFPPDVVNGLYSVDGRWHVCIRGQGWHIVDDAQLCYDPQRNMISVDGGRTFVALDPHFSF